jgi:hypothetical protein
MRTPHPQERNTHQEEKNGHQTAIYMERDPPGKPLFFRHPNHHRKRLLNGNNVCPVQTLKEAYKPWLTQLLSPPGTVVIDPAGAPPAEEIGLPAGAIQVSCFFQRGRC